MNACDKYFYVHFRLHDQIYSVRINIKIREIKCFSISKCMSTYCIFEFGFKIYLYGFPRLSGIFENFYYLIIVRNTRWKRKIYFYLQFTNNICLILILYEILNDSLKKYFTKKKKIERNFSNKMITKLVFASIYVCWYRGIYLTISSINWNFLQFLTLTHCIQ